MSAKDAVSPAWLSVPSWLAARPSPFAAGPSLLETMDYYSVKYDAGALAPPISKCTGPCLASFALFVIYSPPDSPSASALVDSAALGAPLPPDSLSLTLSGWPTDSFSTSMLSPLPRNSPALLGARIACGEVGDTERGCEPISYFSLRPFCPICTAFALHHADG